MGEVTVDVKHREPDQDRIVFQERPIRFEIELLAIVCPTRLRTEIMEDEAEFAPETPWRCPADKYPEVRCPASAGTGRPSH